MDSLDINANVTWQIMPKNLNLTTQVIHLWKIELVADQAKIETGLTLLDADECMRAMNFKFEQHRRRFVIAHAGLRKILGLYTKLTPQALIYSIEAQGKPVLKDYPDLHFSLSHSQELAICAITLVTPLGVDLEFCKPINNCLDIAERFFSISECAELNSLAEHQQLQGFYNAWTRKEAFIKATGEGLHYPLNQFSVSLGPAKKPNIIMIQKDPNQVDEWELSAFIPAKQYTAALAIRRRVNTCHYYSYSI